VLDIESNAGQKAEPAVGQTPGMIPSDNQKEVLSSSTSIGRLRKAVRKTTNALNLQKKLNAMPEGKPKIEPLEISMHDPRY
jgi:hypothetical protein